MGLSFTVSRLARQRHTFGKITVVMMPAAHRARSRLRTAVSHQRRIGIAQAFRCTANRRAFDWREVMMDGGGMTDSGVIPPELDLATALLPRRHRALSGLDVCPDASGGFPFLLNIGFAQPFPKAVMRAA
jgi:hypothetical protein